MIKTIRKSLPVSLDQILKFEIYRLALEQTLSLEPDNVDFLKTKDDIHVWLRRYDTFMSFRHEMKRTAWLMSNILDESPVKLDQWRLHVANNDEVISYIYNMIMDIERASSEQPMDCSETRHEEPMETDIDDLIKQMDSLTI